MSHYLGGDRDRGVRMRRDVKLYLLLVAALLLGFVLVVLLWANDTVELGPGDVVDLPTSEPSGDEPTDVGKRVGVVEPAEDSPKFDCERHGNQRCGDDLPDTGAAYNTGDPLPGGSLCLIDETNGFPVEQAAREFDGLVEVTVGDCDDAANVAVVAHGGARRGMVGLVQLAQRGARRGGADQSQ